MEEKDNKIEEYKKAILLIIGKSKNVNVLKKIYTYAKTLAD